MRWKRSTAFVCTLLTTAGVVVAAWQLYGHRPTATDDFQRAYTAAVLAESKGNSAKAIDEYQIAAERDPLYCGVYQELGGLLERQGRKSAALDAYQRALTCLRGKVVHSFLGFYPDSMRQADIKATSQRIDKLGDILTEPK